MADQQQNDEKAKKPGPSKTQKILDQMGGPGTAAKVKGTVDETYGRVQKKIGDFTNDQDLRTEGLKGQVKGQVTKLVGQAQSTAAKTKVQAEKKLYGVASKTLDYISDLLTKAQNYLNRSNEKTNDKK